MNLPALQLQDLQTSPSGGAGHKLYILPCEADRTACMAG
jgi:hypothetical protein